MKAKNGNRRRCGCARVHAGVRTCMREVGATESGYGGGGNEAEEGAEQMGGGAQTKVQTKTTKREAISKSPQVSA